MRIEKTQQEPQSNSSGISSARKYVVEAAKPASIVGQLGGLCAVVLISSFVTSFLSGDASGWAKAGVVAVGAIASLGALYLIAKSLKVDETSLRFDGDVLLVQQQSKCDLVRWSDIAYATVAERGTSGHVLWRDLVLHPHVGGEHTIRAINRLGFAEGGWFRRVDVVGEQEAALLSDVQAHVEIRF